MKKRAISLLTSLSVVGTALPLAKFMDIMTVNATEVYTGLVINEVCASNAACFQALTGGGIQTG